MAQRKKKQSSQCLQKIAQARHKNEFLRKTKELLLFYLKPQLFEQLPPKVFDYIYRIHYNAPIIDAAPGHKIPKEMLKTAKVNLCADWKSIEIPLFKDGPPISVYNCLTVWMTIQVFWTKITDEDYPHAGKIREALTPYMDLDEKFTVLLNNLYEPAYKIGVINSNIQEHLYWVKFEFLLDKNNIKVQNRLDIYCETPEKRNITIDGNNRPIIRVGGSNVYGRNINWVTIDPALLNINTLESEKPIKVYIQSHALQRLNERLDGLESWFIQLCAYYSLVDPIIIPSGFGYPLIEFRIGNIRAGYFTYTIIDGMLIIRTFLFIINNGTPEGKKLNEITGLGRLDKKYLVIDRISSFISSDIGENETIRGILTQCGCESLLHLNEEVGKPFFCKKKSSQRTAQLIERYLQKPNQEEGYKRYLNIPQLEEFS